MKRVVILILFLLSVAFVAWSLSDTRPGEHSASLDQVIDEIRSEMGLSEKETIDPDAVPEMLLEQLGDAVMAEIHPDEKVHSWMDGMMGGEGSESLASAHRWMGYRYLTDGLEYGYGREGMGMMGSEYSSIPYYSPEEVLNQRYSRGEISREEYQQALEDLKR